MGIESLITQEERKIRIKWILAKNGCDWSDDEKLFILIYFLADESENSITSALKNELILEWKFSLIMLKNAVTDFAYMVKENFDYEPDPNSSDIIGYFESHIRNKILLFCAEQICAKIGEHWILNEVEFIHFFVYSYLSNSMFSPAYISGFSESGKENQSLERKGVKNSKAKKSEIEIDVALNKLEETFFSPKKEGDGYQGYDPDKFDLDKEKYEYPNIRKLEKYLEKKLNFLLRPGRSEKITFTADSLKISFHYYKNDSKELIEGSNLKVSELVISGFAEISEEYSRISKPRVIVSKKNTKHLLKLEFRENGVGRTVKNVTMVEIENTDGSMPRFAQKEIQKNPDFVSTNEKIGQEEDSPTIGETLIAKEE